MKKTIATLGIAGTLVFGAFNLTEVDVVSQFGSISETKTINFGEVVPHTLTVSDNGEIDISTVDKSYKILPVKTEFDTKEGTKGKEFFLDFETSVDEVKIKDVFGKGSDIEIKNSENKVSKVVSFTQDFLKTIPDDVKYVEVSFEITGFNVPNGTYDSRLEVGKNVWLEKSLAWDSSLGDETNDIPNGNYIDIQVEIKDGVLTKKIPIEWLKSAVYPIYTDAVFTFGTKELADTGPSTTVDTMNIGTDKFVNCWVDNADTAQEGRCQVQTVSGTDITFGSASNYESDIISASGNNHDAGGCSAGNDRWVVVYNEDNSPTTDLGRARVASSTGTTINGYGTELTFNNATTSNPVCTQVDTDTIVILYTNQTVVNSTEFPVMKACTIGADYTLTCGSAVQINSRASSTWGDADCEKAATNKFICGIELNSTAESVIFAGTVSGTTITNGKPATTTQNNPNQDTIGHFLISPDTDKFVYTYSSGNGGVSPQRMGLGTISGTVVTLGATSTMMATTTSFTSLIVVDNDSAVWLGQWGVVDQPTTFLGAVPIELNFGTLTFSTSTVEQVDATTDPGSLHAVKIGDCKFAFVWEDDNDTNDLFSIIGDTVGCAVQSIQDIIWFDQD